MTTAPIGQLPDEMFTIIQSARGGAATSSHLGPRLGRLVLSGGKPLETPSFLATTSRGVVPHLTPDTFARDTRIGGVYIGLEDFIEHAPQRTPPLYQFAPPPSPAQNGVLPSTATSSSPLRSYIGLPSPTLLVLGARRTPPVAAPAANPNTNTTLSICTSVGFKALRIDEYAAAAAKVGADVVVAVGDVPFGRALGSKKAERAADRSIQWVGEQVEVLKRRPAAREGAGAAVKVFAPLLPLSCAKQRFYVDSLVEDLRGEIDGLAVYDVQSLEDLPETLDALPRLGFTEAATPQDVLRQIRAGLDVLTVPFITAATDAGIALSFTFGSSGCNGTADVHLRSSPLPLGIDMWSPEHAVDVSPLTPSCTCYACTSHHRAYIQHLLSAKEMLGWVLLQIHNHHVMDRFFEDIRQSLREGNFEDRVERFIEAYEPQLPEKTGRGPRVRGYQYKAEGPGEKKKNAAPFVMLNDGAEKVAESLETTRIAEERR